MTKLECGCRIMSDVIDLNADARDKPAWSYMMKTYSNICGRHSHRQLKFQYMENKLLEMEKARMKMFVEENDEDDEDEEEDETREPDTEEETEEEEEEEPPYEELKAYLEDMSQEDRKKYRQFETLRNLANGLSPNYKMDDINKAIKELQREEEEEYEQSDGNENMHDPYDLWSPRTRERFDRDMERQAKEAEEEEEEENENWENSSLFNHMVSVAMESSD